MAKFFAKYPAVTITPDPNAATAANQQAQIVLATAANSKLDTQIIQGNDILARLSGSFVPAAFDEVALTYTGDNVTTAVYKLGGTTIKTLTLTYSGDQLINVVAA